MDFVIAKNRPRKVSVLIGNPDREMFQKIDFLRDFIEFNVGSGMELALFAVRQTIDTRVRKKLNFAIF